MCNGVIDIRYDDFAMCSVHHTEGVLYIFVTCLYVILSVDIDIQYPGPVWSSSSICCNCLRCCVVVPICCGSCVHVLVSSFIPFVFCCCVVHLYVLLYPFMCLVIVRRIMSLRLRSM